MRRGSAAGVLALSCVLAGGLQIGLAPPASAACTSSRATVGSVSLAPSGTSAPVGSPHTLTATVVGPPGNGTPAPVAGVCVSFEQSSGPSTGWPRTATTAADGTASVTFTSATPGSEVLFAQAFGSQTVASNRVTHTWTAKPSPSPSPRPSVPPPPKPSPSAKPPPKPSPSPPAPSATPSPVPSHVPSATPSPAPTPTPAAPAAPTGSPTPAAPSPGPHLTLDRPSALPGGTAGITGGGCAAGAPVTLTIGGRAAGSTTADGTGAFRAPLQVPDLPVGRQSVHVTCGSASAVVDLDLVVASSGIGAGTAAVASSVLLFFLLLAAALVFRDNSDAQRRAALAEPDDEE